MVAIILGLYFGFKPSNEIEVISDQDPIGEGGESGTGESENKITDSQEASQNTKLTFKGTPTGNKVDVKIKMPEDKVNSNDNSSMTAIINIGISLIAILVLALFVFGVVLALKHCPKAPNESSGQEIEMNCNKNIILPHFPQGYQQPVPSNQPEPMFSAPMNLTPMDERMQYGNSNQSGYCALPAQNNLNGRFLPQLTAPHPTSFEQKADIFLEMDAELNKKMSLVMDKSVEPERSID